VNKNVKIIAISLIVLVILGLIIVPKLISTGDKSTQNQRQNPDKQGQSVSVDAFIVKTQTLDNEVKAIGTIRANEEAEIRSEVSRKIMGIYFKEGTYVGRGKTLFRLDSEDLAARLRKQEIEERLAVSKLEREKQLREKGLTSQEDYDISENTLEQIRADISLTRIEISKTYIRAPFSGIIGLRNVSSGSYVTPAVVLTTMQDVSRVKIDFSIPEKYIYLFRKGQTVKFRVDGVEGEFDGEVYAYEPKVEGNTRSLVLRAVCLNPERRLLPGTFANVTFKLAENENAIMVPSQAIVPKLKGQSVFLVIEGRAKLVDVELGERTEEFVQITSNNLNSGDTVITTNILRIKDNTPVKVIKTE
jgi:membrane fusion protein (multidrug efflux system)